MLFRSEMRKLFLASCALALTSVSYAATFAGTANGVYNTGVNSGSVVLSGGAIDSHYVLIQTPAGCSGLPCTDDANTPFGPDSYVLLDGYPTAGGSPWIANDSSSKWVGPRSNQNFPQVDGTTFPNVGIFASDTDFYVYRMVFNLTALNLNPATAQITLRWASDNSGAPSANQLVDSHIRMCAVSSVSDPACGSGAAVTNSSSLGFSSYKTVNITSGFTSGLVALDFVVYNSVVPTLQNNPSGFRVEILSATADVNTGIPEPSTYALIGSALAALALLRRRS